MLGWLCASGHLHRPVRTPHRNVNDIILCVWWVAKGAAKVGPVHTNFTALIHDLAARASLYLMYNIHTRNQTAQEVM